MWIDDQEHQSTWNGQKINPLYKSLDIFSVDSNFLPQLLDGSCYWRSHDTRDFLNMNHTVCMVSDVYIIYIIYTSISIY